MAGKCQYQTSADDQVGGRTEKLCQPCRKKNRRIQADVFCKNCNQYQCSECEKAHETFDFMSGHEIVDTAHASAVSSVKVAPQLDLKGLDKCSRHDKVFEFFCVDHQVLCCSSCAIELHRKCDEVNGLSTQVSKSSVNATSLISTITKMKTQASAVVDHVQETKATVQTQKEELPGHIDKMKDKVVKMFESLKQNVTEKANKAAQQLKGELDRKVVTSKDIIQSLEKSLVTLQTVVDQGSPVQIYIALHVLQKQIEPFQSSLEEQQHGLHGFNFSIEYKDALTLLLETGDTIGDLKVDKTNMDRPTDSEPESKPIQLTLMTSEDVKQTKGDIREPHYTGLAFLSDERLVVIDNNNDKCYVMNRKLKKLGAYKFEYGPLNVAVMSKTEVAVTSGSKDRKNIHILQVSEKNVITLIRTVKCSSKYDSICLMNDTTFLVSIWDEKRPVRMISMAGDESDFTGLPAKKYKIGTGASSYIRDRNTILYSDEEEHAVYLYDVHDQTCVTRCVVKDENIKGPRGVCVGPDDCIFVCSRNTHSIVQVSLTGKVISSHKVGMRYPRSVCVSQDRTKLAVSNSATGDTLLQIYNLH